MIGNRTFWIDLAIGGLDLLSHAQVLCFKLAVIRKDG